MRTLKTFILFILCTLSAQQNIAQEVPSYKIDIYDDLPSNNVYHLLPDRLGYLWIATDRGVLKYNGYKFTYFDLSKTFVSKDTWSLFEDKEGKIWLYNFSDNFSYIKNDEVHSVKSPLSQGAFYPRYISNYKDGVAIITTFTNNSSVYFYYVRNDSIIRAHDITAYSRFVCFDSAERLIMLAIDGHIYSVDASGKQLQAKDICTVRNYDGPDIHMQMEHGQCNNMGYCICTISGNDNVIQVVDGLEYTYKKIELPEKEVVKLIYTTAGHITAITNQRALFFDAHMNITDSLELPKMADPHIGNKTSFILRSNLWKNALATNSSGVYFLSPKDTTFRQDDRYNEEYKFLGKAGDSIAMWYDGVSGDLCKFRYDRLATRKNLNTNDLIKWLPFKREFSLLFTNLKTYKLNNQTLEVTDMGYTGGAKNALEYNDSQVLCISSIKGFALSQYKSDSFSTIILDRNRYNGIVFDSARQLFIVYNNRKILLLKNGRIINSFQQKDLEQRGITGIVKILPEKNYGNIIIQEGERLIVLPNLLTPYKELLTNYNLTDARVSLYKGTMIVGGTFGILFSKITGPGTFSEPILYPDIRSLRYKVVYDMQVFNNTVYLKTDKGYYEVPVPSAETFSKPPRNTFLEYKMTVSYNNNMMGVSGKDTLRLIKKLRRIKLDVIKPTGNGQVTYQYNLSPAHEQWMDVDGDGELVLPRLAPGKYYTLTIMARDKQWKSNPISITLYMTPEWWEVPAMLRTLWIAGFLCLIAIIYFVVVVTRKIVTAGNRKRNLNLELELKSVHSQINPHFIFNSLTAAMYLIKTGQLNEAYDHVYKFSHLLRAYIKSSRNRTIRLKDEIKNLTTYIELQQVRFKNKFDFIIHIDPLLNTNISIPSLLMQPIVENAITHGLLHKPEKGALKIEFKREAHNAMTCVIDDDGIGRIAAKHIHAESNIKEESYGSELIKDLINIFNKYEKMRIKIEYIDKKLPNTGTTVLLSIKHLTNE